MKPHILTLKDVRQKKSFDLVIELSEFECAALKKDIGILNIGNIIAKMKVFITAKQKGIGVDGIIEADVTQECVVTTQPVHQKISEAFSVRFVPEEMLPEPLYDESGDITYNWNPDYDTEVLIDRQIDLIEIIREYIVLALDPLPRIEGAEFKQDKPVENLDTHKPFAALLQLHKNND